MDDDQKLLTEKWLTDMVVATVAYAGGFLIRFEREVISPEAPNVAVLEPKAMTAFGSSEEWEAFISAMPMGARRGDYDTPALAFRLCLSIGAKIGGVEVADSGNLLLRTSDGDLVRVGGRDDIWEESWSLYVPRDVEFSGPRSIVCSSEGKLHVAPRT